MKFSKGNIKNINKKLLAGTLALTLLTTGLSGCTSINDIEYRRNEQGYIDGILSTVSYRFLKSCKFCKVENKITEESYYTIVYNPSTYRWVEGHDIFTGQNLFEGNFGLEIIDSVNIWLVSLNMVKDSYTEEELRVLLNLFVEKQEKNKQLVKE